jgi:hypothetical protein
VPTARELLDQADALMRRNRLASAAAGEDGIPTLIDAVPVPPASAEGDATPHKAAQDTPTDLEDVPLLTDAVEEIEAPSILEEPPDPDDPDMWTDTLTGAHTIIPAVPIDLPPAPAAATEKAGVLPEEWGAPALAVETIELAPPPPEPFAEPEPQPVGPDAAAPPPPLESFPMAARVEASEPPDGRDTAAGDETQPATPFEWPEPQEPLQHAGAPLAPPQTVSAVAPPPQAAGPGEHAPQAVVAPPPHAFVAAPPHDAVAPAPQAAAPITQPAEPTPASSAAAEEEARWSALAEEVRMQVLQRIDLFTDTGLREQLAARLQPIVDRASADLVATINQHVGVLLRAYVAEAIEREIERWRADGR